MTTYLGTTNSSEDTQSRSDLVAKSIGSVHYQIDIQEAYKSMVGIVEKAIGRKPNFELNGGTLCEDIAL